MWGSLLWPAPLLGQTWLHLWLQGDGPAADTQGKPCCCGRENPENLKFKIKMEFNHIYATLYYWTESSRTSYVWTFLSQDWIYIVTIFFLMFGVWFTSVMVILMWLFSSFGNNCQRKKMVHCWESTEYIIVNNLTLEHLVCSGHHWQDICPQ